MRQELDELMCRRYPEIFRDRFRTSGETSAIWSIRCADGWFNIIESLCAEIAIEVKAGLMPPVVVTQAAAKNGSLSFRIRGGNGETHRLIELARQLSARTCEQCGHPAARLADDGQFVLCPEHSDRMQRARKWDRC